MIDYTYNMDHINDDNNHINNGRNNVREYGSTRFRSFQILSMIIWKREYASSVNELKTRKIQQKQDF